MHCEEMLGAETGIDGDEPGKAAEHETGANREQKREGHFRNNKTAAESLMAADTTAERALLERALEVHAREAKRRHETEDDCSKERSEEGEEQNAGVNGDRFAARQRRVLRNKSEEAVQAQMSEEQSGGHAREREKQAFDEELSNEAGTRGTQRGTNSEFAKAAGAAHEEQVGDIGASDEKKETDGGEQNPERAADSSRGIFEHGKNVGAPVLVVVGPGLGSEVSDTEHILLSLAERDARFEARNNGKIAATIPLFGTRDRQGCPDFRFNLWEGKTSRHYPNHGIRRGVDVYFRSDDFRIGAILPLPEFVAEDDDLVLTDETIGGREKFSRDLHALNSHRLSLKTKIGHQARNGSHGFERFGVVAPVEKIERVHDVARTVIFDGRFPNADEAVWLRIGQGAEENGVNDGENRGIRANAESEGEYRDGREAGAALQHAEREATIASTFVQPANDVDVASVFLEEWGVAEAFLGVVTRILGGHAGGEV